MTSPRLTETISLGNIITILVVVASVALGYGTQVALVEAIETRVTRMEVERVEMDNRIRNLENNFSRIDEKLGHMQQSLGRIAQSVER
jgi:hypothetical protein